MNCEICGEEIYDFEEYITYSIDGSECYIHDRPGCIDYWEQIKDKPRRCEICGGKTNHLVFFSGVVFMVHPDNCIELLRERLGLASRDKSDIGVDNTVHRSEDA